MKLYVRLIKPYIQPPCLQGMNCEPYPVEGWGWCNEEYEEFLREKIVVSDSWSKLFFKEKYMVLADEEWQRKNPDVYLTPERYITKDEIIAEYMKSKNVT